MAEHKDSFWSGPITTERTALRIIKVTGWAFVVAGVVTGVRAGMSHIQLGAVPPFLSAVINFVSTAAPAAFLITRRSRAPAVVMMIVSGLTVVWLMVVTAVWGGDVTPPVKLLAWLTAAVWVVLFALAWRSYYAASMLRRQAREGAGAGAGEVEVEVFD